MIEEKKIGVVADLSENGSIHQTTFMRAISSAYNCLVKSNIPIQLIWENDFATFEGGKLSAQKLVDEKVDCIIGHYASSAAFGALSVYEKTEIPVFLPAATADFLTTDFRNSFRLCNNDSSLVKKILTILQEDELQKVFIENDNSLHGQLVSKLIIEEFKTKKIIVVEDLFNADGVVFVGSYSNSVLYLKELDRKLVNQTRIYFTDDVVHSKLPFDTMNSRHLITVIGYKQLLKSSEKLVSVGNHYKQEWGQLPGTYYMETYASMEIAFQLLTKFSTNLTENLFLEKWSTVIGEIVFDSHGESGIDRFSKWLISKQELIEFEI